MRWKLDEIENGLQGSKSKFRKGYFDSALIKITYEYDDFEHVYGESALSFDCIRVAT